MVEVTVAITELKSFALKLEYQMVCRKQGTGEAEDRKVFAGHSEHCFLDREGKFIRLNKEFPDFYETLKGQVREPAEGKHRRNPSG